MNHDEDFWGLVAGAELPLSAIFSIPEISQVDDIFAVCTSSPPVLILFPVYHTFELQHSF